MQFYTIRDSTLKMWTFIVIHGSHISSRNQSTVQRNARAIRFGAHQNVEWIGIWGPIDYESVLVNTLIVLICVSA